MSGQYSHFIPPENTRPLSVLYCSQGVYNQEYSSENFSLGIRFKGIIFSFYVKQLSTKAGARGFLEQSCKSAPSLKKRLQLRCFAVNIAKFLRSPK